MFDFINIIYATYAEVKKMATNIDELAPELAQIKAFLQEAHDELLGKINEQLESIAALEAALGGAGALPQEAQDILVEIRALSESMANVIQQPVEPPAEDPIL